MESSWVKVFKSLIKSQLHIVFFSSDFKGISFSIKRLKRANFSRKSIYNCIIYIFMMREFNIYNNYLKAQRRYFIIPLL